MGAALGSRRMELNGGVAVVTGAARGIGAALARAFAKEGAHVVVADLDADGCRTVADELGGTAVPTDVSRAEQVTALVESTLARHGRIDLFASNAGVGLGGGPDAPDEVWETSWRVNVMAHVWAARAVVPAMLERGGGTLLQTVSAAALVNHIDAAPYAVTKAAALSFAEWLSINHGDQGLQVSCLCPQGVNTAMLREDRGGVGALLRQDVLEPEDVAAAALAGLREGRFLILPHPAVGEYIQRKATDYDRWLRGMRRLRAQLHPVEDAPAES